ncbi:MAG: PAS domain-containing protein [Chloroflexi bacterium]|nr:PAS domain-containing protein [Chloroflexota bacterium]
MSASDGSDSIASSSEEKPDASKRCIASREMGTESAELLALAEQMAHLGSWQYDFTTNRALWSTGLFHIFGLPPQPCGLSLEDYRKTIHPNDVDFVDQKMSRLLSSGGINDKVSLDYRIVLQDGAVRILHSERTVKEIGIDGKPIVIFGIEQDVTEQKKAEEALKKSEERFRFVAEAANVMVYETDVESGKIRILRGAEQLVGYKSDEIDFTVNWVLNRMHPDDVPHVLAQLKAATENPNIEKYILEYRFLHKNGNYIVVKDTAKAVKDSAGKTIRFIGGIRNITQRRMDKEKIEQYSKQLEQIVEERTKQLIISERFAAIGQVAGMVGHDIRNPLQALMSEVYLLKSDISMLPEGEAQQEMKMGLESIEKNVGYINKIIADLQDYSRQLNPEYTEVDLADLIVSVFETIPIPEKITLSFDIKTLPKLNADPTFIRRALTNLVNNAIQAMPNGGKLEIAGFERERSVYILVTDTGVGIPDEVKNKLFTPMFTTKAKGQGLGLAVVKRLVEAQGGSISFESAIDKGTKFVIKLPLS